MIRRLLILLVGLWLIAEVVAIPVASKIIVSQVATRTRDATTVHASLGSFPVIARVIFLQRVSSVSVTLDRVTGQRIPFTEIRFDAKGVGVDRTRLFQGKVHITSIESGTVTATLDLPGRIGSAVRMQGRTLMVGAVALAIRSDLIPCTPVARVQGQQVTLSCSFTNVPPVLLEEAQK